MDNNGFEQKKKYSRKFSWGFGKRKSLKLGSKDEVIRAPKSHREVMAEKRRRDEAAKLAKQERLVKTYSFEPTGTTHDCRFGKMSRQSALNLSKEGDCLSLKLYEWQGDPALAIMNDRINCDIGVAAKGKDLTNLLMLFQEYDSEGEILKFDKFEYRDNIYHGVDVMFSFYKKEAQEDEDFENN